MDVYDTNETMEDLIFPAIKQPDYLIAIYSIAYSAIFLCALVGNSMVVMVVIRTPRMRNVTYYYLIANLAIADILVAIFCIPITLLSNIYNGWPFGAFMCKATPYLQGVSVSASVNTLAAVAVDRYLAICRAPEWRVTIQSSKIAIGIIWLVALVVPVPWAIFYVEFEHKTPLQELRICHQLWPNFESQKAYFVSAIFFGCYILPLLIVLVCYIFIGLRVWNRHAPGVAKDNSLIRKSKIKVVKMLAVMVALFALSWLPLHVIYLKLHFDTHYDEKEQEFIWHIAIPLSQWLGLSNSGINPIIYCFFSKNFRGGFASMLHCIKRRRERHASAGYSSTTKYMTIEYANGHVTITFKKDTREESSSTL